MSAAGEITLLSATALRRRIESGELSPIDAVEASLAAIERRNGPINAIVTLSDRAMDDARELTERAARGEPKGLLHGLPVGIKDTTAVAGLRTTFGSPMYADHVPDHDALVVRRLRHAGAVIIGKTNCPEFAAGGNTFNEVFGPTCNPWDVTLSAGGSTGGGAAGLAAGMIALAEGSDLGGSLRIPASFCGVVGLRPSPGLVPTYPADYAWDTLSVTGPMARTAEDVALMLQAIHGPAARAPVSQPRAERDFPTAVAGAGMQGLRVAYCPDVAGIGVDGDVESMCRKTALEFRQLGAEVEMVDLDLAFAREAFHALRGYWMVAYQSSRLDRIDRFGANVAGNVRAGLALDTATLGRAEASRGKLFTVFADLFDRFDHLVTPTVAVAPFPVTQNYPEVVAGNRMTSYVDWLAPTFVLSLTGLPVASVPCGLDPSGLPVGMQIVGRPHCEEAVLAAAAGVETIRGAFTLPDG